MIDLCRPLYSILRENLKDILSKRATGRLKEDNTFVSEGDILSQEIIFSYFRDRLDNCLIISEESSFQGEKPEEYDFVVTIDPIDGTENFVSGLKEWGVAVSIYRNMTHYQSLISLPELGICLCSGDNILKSRDSRICGISSYVDAKQLLSLPKGFEYRIMGCCVYNIYNVIQGAFRRFQHLSGAYSWDVLAGFNLALENNIKIEIDGIGEYRGQFLRPGVKYYFTLSQR